MFSNDVYSRSGKDGFVYLELCLRLNHVVKTIKLSNSLKKNHVQKYVKYRFLRFKLIMIFSFRRSYLNRIVIKCFKLIDIHVLNEKYLLSEKSNTIP